MNPKQEILKLKDGESWIWSEFNSGGVEIWFKYGYYFIFNIPMYGGNPVFECNFPKHQIDHLIETVNSWT